MKIKIFLFGVMVIQCLTACKKYLDEKPDRSRIVPGTVRDMQTLLDNPSSLNNRGGTWDECSADNYFIPPLNYPTITEPGKDVYTWRVRDYILSADWLTSYEQVYVSNVVLKGMEKISRDEGNKAAWDNVMGSAVFFRANAFLHLAFVFAKSYDPATAATDLGVVLRNTDDFTQSFPRSSVEDTYTRILSDLKLAAELLPVTPAHVMRPSRPAAYGLLARTYLSMRQYDSCFKYANLCLQLGPQLMNYASITVAPTATKSFTRFNTEVIFHTVIQGLSPNNLSTSICRVDSLLYKSYQADDLRKNHYFLQRPDGFQFRGSYDGTTTYFNGLAWDELYLMRAECNARAGKIEEAMTDLNTLMAKRWKTGFIAFTATTGDEALNMILTERRKELLFRGLRWMDIKRLNKEGRNIVLTRTVDGVVYTLPPNDNRYAILIPMEIIRLSGIEQNPQ